MTAELRDVFHMGRLGEEEEPWVSHPTKRRGQVRDLDPRHSFRLHPDEFNCGARYPDPPLKSPPPLARDGLPPGGGGIARVFQGKPWYPPLMQANRTQVKRLLH